MEQKHRALTLAELYAATDAQPDPTRVSRATRNQGQNWIRPEKRLAIYLRDGLACVWCGTSIEDDAKLTLDHLRPYGKGGSNHETNLTTCCHKCNSVRQDRSAVDFATVSAAYIAHGITPHAILEQIAEKTARPLDMAEAKAMISRRGSCFAALQSLKR